MTRAVEQAEPLPDFSGMTKAELQTYADEHGIEGVNSSRQTKAEMIGAITGGV